MNAAIKLQIAAAAAIATQNDITEAKNEIKKLINWSKRKHKIKQMYRIHFHQKCVHFARKQNIGRERERMRGATKIICDLCIAGICNRSVIGCLAWLGHFSATISTECFTYVFETICYLYLSFLFALALCLCRLSFARLTRLLCQLNASHQRRLRYKSSMCAGNIQCVYLNLKKHFYNTHTTNWSRNITNIRAKSHL